MAKPKNDQTLAVTKFCLSMEEHRRTEAGRVRTARELVLNFFPYDENGATDKLFHRMPNEVRGPVLSGWGIRGSKAALKDDDDKIRQVVHDALVAGDIDEATFEDGVTPQILVDWVALQDWWSFWRHGKLTGVAIQKALATARELELIDDRWFLLNVQGRGGKLKGTDVLCDTLSKDQIVVWMRKLHESGDGSPSGIIAAIGWETVLTKTAQDALLFALDAFAKKAGLAPDAAQPSEPTSATTSPGGSGGSAGKGSAAPSAQDEPAEAVPAPTQIPAADAGADSGFPVAIPDMPAVDSADADEPPVTPNLSERAVWGQSVAPAESPKLAEARAKMMEMLGPEPATGPAQGWGNSEIPQKPSGLEWPEPPPILGTPPLIGGAAKEEPSKVPAPPPLPKKPGGTPSSRR